MQSGATPEQEAAHLRRLAPRWTLSLPKTARSPARRASAAPTPVRHGRAWGLNEKERTAIVKKLKDADPDQLPDLRWTALVSALMLLILFPLLFQQAERFFHLYKVNEEPTFCSWFWFSIDKTYLKALPDWSILYGVHSSSIDFDAPWGRHLVLLSRLTFDYILIQGLPRQLAIRATIREAVAVLAADPSTAVRLGKRALAPLIAKLQDPDKVVRGAAANARSCAKGPAEFRRLITRPLHGFHAKVSRTGWDCAQAHGPPNREKACSSRSIARSDSPSRSQWL